MQHDWLWKTEKHRQTGRTGTDGQPGFTGYEFDLIEYDKDEYIKIQAEKNADLENEITQAQIAMCEIYEMMG